MALRAKRILTLGLGPLLFAAVMFAYTPVAEAQFFFRWLDEQAKPKPRKRAPKPKTPSIDDLPPIVPKEESAAPPPPDDRPYDAKLLRLAEILGAVHYLRELCGAQEGQLWREQMRDILQYEGTTAVRRAKLVSSFNDGYRGYRRTYRTCTPSATVATTRFSTEGARIAATLAQSSEYASRSAPAPEAPKTEDGASAPPPDGAAAKPAAPAGGAAPGAAAAGQSSAAQEVQPSPTPVPPKKKRKKAQSQVTPPD